MNRHVPMSSLYTRCLLYAHSNLESLRHALLGNVCSFGVILTHSYVHRLYQVQVPFILFVDAHSRNNNTFDYIADSWICKFPVALKVVNELSLWRGVIPV